MHYTGEAGVRAGVNDAPHAPKSGGERLLVQLAFAGFAAVVVVAHWLLLAHKSSGGVKHVTP